MSLTELYLKDSVNFYDGRDFWYVGTENTVEQGVNSLLAFLRNKGYVLIGEPEVIDYLAYGTEIIYRILYQALPKLEYLEYMYDKVVNIKSPVKI